MKQIYFGVHQQTSGTTTEIPYISSTAKAILSIIILMVISIFSITSSSALDFLFNSPEKAESDIPFTASLSASASLQYDVKIFIQDENKIIVSQIFNNGWKNPFYFLKSIFPNQTEFQIRSLNASGNYQICARLRESGKTSFTEKCNNITIISSEKQEETFKKEEDNKNLKNITKKDNSEKLLNENNQKSINYQDTQDLNYIPNENSQKQKIILRNSQAQKFPQSQVFTTKYETTRNFILYFFTAFCIIIIILLALRQL